MRECVKHRMTMGQLARFTSANGLYLNGSRIYALDGKNVGRVRLASSRAFRPESFGLDKPRASGQGRSARVVRGAPLILSVIQGLYNLSAQADHDGCQITAWRPAWRPARTLITGDGEMEAGDLLGPEEVICDLCNTDVSIRPLPMGGSYALCTACLARQGMPFPGTISPYCLLPARDGEGVRW